MNQRYWEPDDDHPSIEMLKDWVCENVIAAQQDLMDEGKGWLDVRNGGLVFTFVSHEKPAEDGEPSDLWSKSFNVIDMLQEWLSDYGPYDTLSPAQKKHVEARAKAIDDIANMYREKSGIPPRYNSTPSA